MKRGEALAETRRFLAANHVEDAALEGEILLRHVLGADRALLFSSLDEDITNTDCDRLTALAARRAEGEPAAYITGHKEFYGLDFAVNRDVLIPRPETERLAEKAIVICQERNYKLIADIGTGCGAIAVTLAVNLPDTKIVATDISAPVLEVAQQNARQYHVGDRITFLQGDLLLALTNPVPMIVANLPYVKTADLPPGGPLRYEPRLALDGGEKGLDKIQLLVAQTAAKLKSNGSLLLEVGEGQAGEVADDLHKVFPQGEIEITKDLAGIERVVGLRLT